MKLLRVWAGPMCAAKTTGALHVARRYARHGKKVVLIRPASSRRSHESFVDALTTKNGESFPCYDIASVVDIPEFVIGADVVWIDEPNHFKNEQHLIEVMRPIRENSTILVSGLGATSEMEPFGQSMAFFLATADHVHWLTADCDGCGTHAAATRSLYIGESPKSHKIQVGGAESYRPVCPDCWTNFIELEPAERRRWMKIL